MSTENKNIIYTAADIEKYFTGKLSPAQMHEMEKAALDDPFLAEAMEGYEGMKGKDWKGTLAAVRRQVEQAGSEAKVIPMHRSVSRWWRSAAAFLLIATGAAATYLLTKNKPGEKAAEQIAQAPKIATDSAPANYKVNSSVQSDSVKISVNNVPATNTQANGTIAQVNTKDSSAGYLSVTRPPVTDSARLNDFASANAGNAAPSTVTINAPVTTALPPPAGDSKKPEETVVKDKALAEKNTDADNYAFKKRAVTVQNKKDQQFNNFFNAQVVGADNTPLPFSNISIRNESFGTYADVKGNFRLVSIDTVMNIEVRSIGYKSRNFLLKSNQSMNRIVLLEDNAGTDDKADAESRDMAAGKKTRRPRLLTDSLINVEPADGWENYNTYVANNLEIPDEMLNKEFHGEVELSFDVKANGTISNIRVDKSMGAAYDEAAKRLIERGPQWKVKKGKRSKASVRVKF